MSHIYHNRTTRFLQLLWRNGLSCALCAPFRRLFAAWIIAGTPRGSFAFRGRSYAYFLGSYNTTWINERSVEIPIIRGELTGAPADEVLEIGHVLGHYGDVGHQVLDKFERGPGIIGHDVCRYVPARRYSRIVSISTFEHIGYDDDGGSRPEDALDRCRQWLTPDGRLTITAPLGYSRAFDRLVATGWPPAGQTSFMLRTGRTRWHEASRQDALAVRYGRPYPYGNGLVVITVGPEPGAPDAADPPWVAPIGASRRRPHTA